MVYFIKTFVKSRLQSIFLIYHSKQNICSAGSKFNIKVINSFNKNAFHRKNMFFMDFLNKEVGIFVGIFNNCSFVNRKKNKYLGKD